MVCRKVLFRQNTGAIVMRREGRDMTTSIADIIVITGHGMMTGFGLNAKIDAGAGVRKRDAVIITTMIIAAACI